MDTSHRVLVVGAGLSGLMAAATMEQRGWAVTVLEARERSGGRVWSSTLPNAAVIELGAEWIMADDHLVRSAAERFGIGLVETGADYRRREPWGPGAGTLDAQAAFLEAANAAHEKLSPAACVGFTLGGFLDSVPSNDEAARRLVKIRLQGTCARSLNQVALEPSGNGEAFTLDGGPYFRMVGGNQGLADAMADSLVDVRTGQIVEAVEADSGGVTVHMGSRTESGTAAVVAVPAPIASRLRFMPALPDDVASALTTVPMGVASKFAVATHERPPPRTRQSSDISMWCWAANGEDGGARPCIASFAGSAEAQRSLGIDRGRIGPWFERIRHMNPDVTFDGEPVIYSWADDPFAMGAYSAWDRASKVCEEAGAFTRLVDHVAFAGEHTAGPDHHGTMEGALRSGIRAAEQLSALLG